jgi:hypothetical protein
LVGFAAPFGTAPPDFTAVSLVNYSNTAARLHLEWALPGVTTPFVAPLSATHAAIAQSTLAAAAEHVVGEGPVRLDPSTLTGGLTLAADANAANTAFAIGHLVTQRVDSFSTFADLITALTTDLNGTTALLEIDARGPYNSATGAFAVDEIAVLLDD